MEQAQVLLVASRHFRVSWSIGEPFSSRLEGLCARCSSFTLNATRIMPEIELAKYQSASATAGAAHAAFEDTSSFDRVVADVSRTHSSFVMHPLMLREAVREPVVVRPHRWRWRSLWMLA
jgi:hypothetical protein